MSIANFFYHGTTKRYISLFGTIFNKLSIERYDSAGTRVQRMIVPVSYGPYQKFLARLTQDPKLDRKTAISLPRMSFEIMSIEYDGERKLPSLNKIRRDDTESGARFQYVPAPFNIEFNLYIMVKNAEDATQIVEQIYPFFKPEWTPTVEIMDGLPPYDIPIIYRSTSIEDIYEGLFEQRRAMLWTLSFTMKAFFFGPIRERKVIKFVDVRTYDTEHSGMYERVTVQPGLTANGEPTSDITETVDWEDIEAGDDWGIITLISDEDPD